MTNWKIISLILVMTSIAQANSIEPGISVHELSEDLGPLVTLPEIAPLPVPRPDRTFLSDQRMYIKAVKQGVPGRAVIELLKFRREKMGAEFLQETYVCRGREETSVKPCAENERISRQRTVTLTNHTFAVIIDYSKPSTEERLFILNFETGEVDKMLTSHGLGSGNGNTAYKFSNVKDSRQTSLGMHLLGEVYTGSYGPTLRMYGLEKSNDRAYHRDIVMHGAWYADRSFMKTENYKTKQSYGRLGVSWGCPAISPSLQKRWVNVLRGGALIYHYHPELQRRAQSGWEVQTPFPPPEYIPLPMPRPEFTPELPPTP